MYWVFNLLLICIPAQWYFGLGAPWSVIALLFCTIAKLLCIGRVIGITLRPKVFMILEGVGLFFTLVGSAMTKEPVNLASLSCIIGFSLFACALYFIDDTFYVYVTEEEIENNDQDS